MNNLMDAGEITDGFVDNRPIQTIPDTAPEGYTRCHFFAGIAGWDLALKLAGWPEDLPVWTGSCPCQPFSVAGHGKGEKDERHLWPDWYSLISIHEPPVIFGEQVAAKAGRAWLAGVQVNLEALGYSFGAADLCAAGIGAPHIRQRLWWVASRGLADGDRERLQGRSLRCDETGKGCERDAGTDVSHFWDNYVTGTCADGKSRRTEPGLLPVAHGVPARMGQIRAYGNAIVPPLAAEFITACMEYLGIEACYR